jgi:hypothetical protein
MYFTSCGGHREAPIEVGMTKARTNPLPKTADIRMLRACLYRNIADVPPFEVPRDHWEQVAATLLPAELEPESRTTPAAIPAYEVLGRAEFLLVNGEQITVEVYMEEIGIHSVGAYSIDGTYYRGGSSVQFRDLVLRLYDEHTKAQIRHPETGKGCVRRG